MPEIFHLQEQFLRLMGHNTGNVRNSWSIKYIATLLLVAFAQYPMASFIIYNRDDLELVTACLCTELANLLCTIKIIAFLINKQDFFRMMHDFRQMNLQPAGNCYSCVNKANILANRLVRAHSTSCFFTVLYFMLGPLVKILLAKIHGTSIVLDLPMPMKFPFNVSTSPGYQICYIYTFLMNIAIWCYMSAIDGLFISFAINLRAHFQALQHVISTAIAIDSIEGTRELDRERERKLIGAVEYHVKVLELAKCVRLTFVLIVFGQFLITSMLFGVIIYQILTHLDSTMALLLYSSYLSSIMIQLLIYCYGGEVIKTESSKVGIAVQLSNWDQAVPSERRILAFIMLRSQRESLITAGFFKASLENFTAICNTAFSFIALIQSIAK